MKHQLTSIGFALLIVTSVFAMPMNNTGMNVVGTASASHDCDTTDAAVAAITFTYVNKDKCLNNHVSHAVEEVRDYETEKTKIDLYSAGTGQKARSEVYTSTVDNYLQDTDSIAWNKAEVAVAEAYQNGSTKAEAKIEARKAISAYYATKQNNLVESWNSDIASTMYLRERAEQESFSDRYVRTKVHTNNADESEGRIINWGNSTVTNVNGTSLQVRDVVIQNYNTQSGSFMTVSDYNQTERVHIAHGKYDSAPSFDKSSASYTESRAIEIQGYDESTENTELVNFTVYKQRWDKIDSKETELKNEANTFVDSTWQDYQDGNIDSTDVISRNTLMFEYGTAMDSGNSTYYDAIGAAAGMGLDTPELNGTGQMQITVPASGNTYQGLIFARSAPNNTWQVGTEYSPDSIEGPVMLATVDGNLTELSRNFVIDEAVDKNNNTQETVETTNYNYQTADTGDLNEKYDRLLAMTQELENRSQSVGTGGGSTGGNETTDDPQVPDWLTDTYGGIPVYGFILTGIAGAYVVATAKKE